MHLSNYHNIELIRPQIMTSIHSLRGWVLECTEYSWWWVMAWELVFLMVSMKKKEIKASKRFNNEKQDES